MEALPKTYRNYMNEVIDAASKNAEQPLSAYEKAAEKGIDPRCIPQNLDGPPPVGEDISYPSYSETDLKVWNTLYSRQTEMLEGRASDAFYTGATILGFQPDTIPSLSGLSKALTKATDWKVARVPGLLHERDFFTLLSERTFSSTDYIRGEHEIDYTPAPDLFHDIFGHMPMLANESFADFYQMFGRAALGAEGQDRVSLERLHWFTVEFGLVQQAEGRRIFGAGVLSSKGEVYHALSDAVTVHPFNIEKIISQDYEVWHLQDTLFALESFEQLVEGFQGWAQDRGLLPS